MQALPDDWHVVTLDNRGAGASSRPAGPGGVPARAAGRGRDRRARRDRARRREGAPRRPRLGLDPRLGRRRRRPPGTRAWRTGWRRTPRSAGRRWTTSPAVPRTGAAGWQMLPQLTAQLVHPLLPAPAAARAVVAPRAGVDPVADAAPGPDHRAAAVGTRGRRQRHRLDRALPGQRAQARRADRCRGARRCRCSWCSCSARPLRDPGRAGRARGPLPQPDPGRGRLRPLAAPRRSRSGSRTSSPRSPAQQALTSRPRNENLFYSLVGHAHSLSHLPGRRCPRRDRRLRRGRRLGHRRHDRRHPRLQPHRDHGAGDGRPEQRPGLHASTPTCTCPTAPAQPTRCRRS